MANICEVYIQNPITHASIDQAMAAVEQDASDLLVLDLGEHEF